MVSVWEDNCHDVGGKPGPSDVPLSHRVGRFHGTQPDSRVVADSLGANDEIGFLYAPVLLLTDSTVLQRIIYPVGKLVYWFQQGALHNPRSPDAKSPGDPRPDSPVKTIFEVGAFKVCDIRSHAVQAGGHSQKLVGEQRPQQQLPGFGVGLELGYDAGYQGFRVKLRFCNHVGVLPSNQPFGLSCNRVRIPHRPPGT